MTNDRRIGLGRQASSSVSLGSEDPRLRRSNQALTTRGDYDESLTVGNDGRLGVTKARGVPFIVSPSGTAETTINDILRVLKAAGLMER
jgi:hypothetical protein